MEKIMTQASDVVDSDNYVKYLDHGFVGLIDVMGDDDAIDQAARCSYGKGTRATSDKRALIRYLVRHLHTSPIEMVELKFHMKIPIFIMRQHVRHRTASLNEYSGRYSEMTDEMYMPEPERFQYQSEQNKQGSGATMSDEDIEACQFAIGSVFQDSYSGYKELLDLGLAKEIARIQLPLSTYTELYWKIDLKNFLHYICLREDQHAQKEIRDLADIMYAMVKPLLPITCEAYEDYWSWKNTARFSRMEVDLLKSIVSDTKWADLANGHRNDKGLAEAFGVTVRELNEFKTKMGLV